MWGEEQIFSWHPFETNRFVGASGEALNYNRGSQQVRQEFVAAGKVAEYDPAVHTAPNYQRMEPPHPELYVPCNQAGSICTTY